MSELYYVRVFWATQSWRANSKKNLGYWNQLPPAFQYRALIYWGEFLVYCFFRSSTDGMVLFQEVKRWVFQLSSYLRSSSFLFCFLFYFRVYGKSPKANVFSSWKIPYFAGLLCGMFWLNAPEIYNNAWALVSVSRLLPSTEIVHDMVLKCEMLRYHCLGIQLSATPTAQAPIPEAVSGSPFRKFFMVLLLFIL